MFAVIGADVLLAAVKDGIEFVPDPLAPNPIRVLSLVQE